MKQRRCIASCEMCTCLRTLNLGGNWRKPLVLCVRYCPEIWTGNLYLCTRGWVQTYPGRCATWMYICSRFFCVYVAVCRQSRGSQVSGSRALGRLNFVRWDLMSVGVQYATCFVLAFWREEFWGGCRFLEDLCAPEIGALRRADHRPKSPTVCLLIRFRNLITGLLGLHYPITPFSRTTFWLYVWSVRPSRLMTCLDCFIRVSFNRYHLTEQGGSASKVQSECRPGRRLFRLKFSLFSSAPRQILR
jgi:hypothetical protein